MSEGNAHSDRRAGDRRQDHAQRSAVDRFRASVPLGQNWAAFSAGDDLRCAFTVTRSDGGRYVCATFLDAVAEAPLYLQSLGTVRQITTRTTPTAVSRGRCKKCQSMYRLSRLVAPSKPEAEAKPAA